MIELQVEINNNVSDTLTEIEKYLSSSDIEIKQIKRSSKDDLESEKETIILVGHYNKKEFNKNELLRNITSIESVGGIIEV